MPSVRKTPSLSLETRLRVLHEQRDRRLGELGRIERRFNVEYPKLDYLAVLARKSLIDQERMKVEKIEKAIAKFSKVMPAPNRQTTFGFE